MDVEIIDDCRITVLVDNVMDILSTTSSSVAWHIPNVFKAGARAFGGLPALRPPGLVSGNHYPQK